MALSQAELRRRIRAAMAASGVDTWAKLADATGWSWSTLKELGKSSPIGPKHYLAVAQACDVPEAWFTVPDLGEAVRLGSLTEPSDPRVEMERELEARVQEERQARQRDATAEASARGQGRQRKAR